MKKLKFISIIFIAFFFFSCATNNPFTDNNPYVSVIGEPGDYIFTTSDQALINQFVSVEKVSFYRISGSYNPVNQNYYGALEGKFSKFIAETGLNLSNEFKKIKINNLNVWVHNKSSLQIVVPANGIILFANKDIDSVYEMTYKFKETRLSPEITRSLINAETSLYIKKPSVMPNFGLDLSDSSLERFDYIFLSVNKNDNSKKYSVEFSMTSQVFSDSFFKLIKMAYTTAKRQEGIRPSVEQLKETITQELKSVYLKNQDYSDEIVLDIIDVKI